MAWILKRNEEDYKASWLHSIATSTSASSTKQAISSSIETAAREIENSEHVANPERLPITASDLEDAVSMSKLDGLALYDYGPTAVFTWQRCSEFNYLELHYES